MEDWYLAVLATTIDTLSPRCARLPHQISRRHARPHPLAQCHSLSSLSGVKETTAVEGWVIGRLMKELSKVGAQPLTPTPPNTLPGQNTLLPQIRRLLHFTRVRRTRFLQIMLKELTPDGEASIGIDIAYNSPPGGEMRITVSALATISLPKKKEDKPHEVSLVLAVVVKKLVGNMIVKIKKPPL
ncbi:hypothetical protein M422DRAFT_264412 [Sphaerobolus stellatus SS14]|uniref:Uncharacterized protein n=1 Tax=Sphaerobolus stellatus (strain SS14) TaxID=990650 RepID=A0A0C9UWJ2_SPHS4|nr:hypothetical protein M422DRAFT_264412 [Sphaerobolus stellatus SS14]